MRQFLNAPAPGFSKVNSTVAKIDSIKAFDKVVKPSDQPKSPKIGNSSTSKTFKDCFANPHQRRVKVAYGQARSVKNLLDRPKFQSTRVLSVYGGASAKRIDDREDSVFDDDSLSQDSDKKSFLNFKEQAGLSIGIQKMEKERRFITSQFQSSLK